MSSSGVLESKAIGATRCRVLVVDDDDDVRATLAEAMAAGGVEMRACRDGAEALAVTERERFDVVLSDVRMPGMSGLELLRRIRDRDVRAPEVILMSGDASISTPEALAEGAAALLLKPTELGDLVPAVRAAAVPPALRWCGAAAMVRGAAVESELEVSSNGLASRMQLGRGGVFVPLASDFPCTYETVGVRLRDVAPDLPLLEGVALVRWVRQNRSDGYPAGVGLEFLALDASSLDAALAAIATERPRAYVPLGRRL